MFKALKKFLRILGPGIITGASDDDPSGIATYSQTGAQFGYGQLWTALYLLPLLVGVQEACARIGVVTGKGIAAVVREHFSKPLLYLVVLLVLIAITINIGADIGAMAAAANLLFPLPFVVFPLLFTALILTLEIFLSYKVYARAQMVDALPAGLSPHGLHRGRAVAHDLAGDLSAPHRIQFPIPLHYYGCTGDDHLPLHVLLAGI